MTYCAISALSFLGKLSEEEPHKDKAYLDKYGINFEECIKCLVSRQTTYIEEPDEDERETMQTMQINATPLSSVGYIPQLGHLSIDDKVSVRPPPSLVMTDEHLKYAGFNGRANKVADTCYCFWNLGSLAVSSSAIVMFPNH